jgi:hypothetical protein
MRLPHYRRGIILWKDLNRRMKAELMNQLRNIQDKHSAIIAVHQFFERQQDEFESFFLDLNWPVAEDFYNYIKSTRKAGAYLPLDLEKSIRLQAEESAKWMVEGHQKLYEDLAAKDESYKFDNIAQRLDDEMTSETEVITQVSSASNMGALEGAYDEYEYKQWNAILDNKTRETHAEANGQIVPIDSLFAVGLELMMHPGDMSADPGEWKNCRCSLMFYREDEVATGYYRPEGD